MPKRTKWAKKFRTPEELMELAKPYATRGELFNKNKNLYLCLYQRGLLDQACLHMKPSRKKNKFVVGTLNVAKVISPVFKCANLIEFREKYQSAYDAGRRYGVDYVELFENRDDPKYLQNLIVEIGQVNMAKFMELKNGTSP